MSGRVNNRLNQTGFMRNDGYSLDMGVVISYRLVGYHFRVIISRHGVSFSGAFPTVERLGIQYLTDILWRAVRHHEHLKLFKEGTKQTALDERILDAEEAAHQTMTVGEGSKSIS